MHTPGNPCKRLHGVPLLLALGVAVVLMVSGWFWAGAFVFVGMLGGVWQSWQLHVQNERARQMSRRSPPSNNTSDRRRRR